MKKSLLLTFLTMFIFSSLVVADPPAETGTIVFTGFIESRPYFSVAPLNDGSVDLLSETMQPGNPGVDIGTWTLRVDNPPIEATTFKVSYVFEPLRSTIDTIDDEIAFELLERPEEGDDDPVIRVSDSFVNITVGAGSALSAVTKIFAARLTDAGYSAALVAAATDTYRSDILVSLSVE